MSFFINFILESRLYLNYIVLLAISDLKFSLTCLGVCVDMAFYELVFIIRQDISSSDVDKIINDFSNIAKENGAVIVKTEYWGLRTLAYEINNNSKGHYVFLGLKTESATVQEIERRMKLSEDIIRFLTIRVDEISSEPSPILRNKNTDSEEIIDVTVNKD